MPLDPEVEALYHDRLVEHRFFSPFSDIHDFRARLDHVFNDEQEITDIAFWEDRTLSFDQTITDAPKYRLKPEYEDLRRFSEQITRASVPDLPVRIYHPDPDTRGLPVLIYFHESAFIVHNIASHDSVCRKLAKEFNTVVISLGYRLAPEDPYPAAFQDGWAALCWVREHANELKVDPERIMLSGDSSGAILASAISRLDAMHEVSPDYRDPVQPIYPLYAQILFYGLYGSLNLEESESFKKYANGGYVLPKDMIDATYSVYKPADLDPDDPIFSPGNGKLPDTMPMSIVINAEYDPCYDDGSNYCACLKESGNVVHEISVPGFMHGFMLYWYKFSAVEGLLKEIAVLL